MMKRKGGREPSHGILKVPARDNTGDGSLSPNVRMTNGTLAPQGQVKFDVAKKDEGMRNGVESPMRLSPRPTSRVSSASSRQSDVSMVSTLSSLSSDNFSDLRYYGSRRPLSVLSLCSSSTAGQGPLAHLGFAGSRHMHPERLPTLRFEKAVNLRLTDLSPESLESYHSIASTLRRLELSKLQLTSVSKELLQNLEGLEALGLSRNKLSDSSFPEAFKNLQALVDLKLDYNNLSKFPQNLQKLKSLQRLTLSSNKLTTVDGIDKLKRLTILVLDNNKLRSLFKEVANMRRLEVCYCSNNELREIQPASVKLLRHLRTIDLSNNKISSLPPEIFTLPHLDLLNASHNQINRLPTITIRGVPKHTIKQIDLSENQIIRFPEHLLIMCKSLDISENKISKIAGNTIRKLAWRSDKSVDVSGNPLIAPPLELCECGLRAMIQHFQERKAETKTYQGTKLLVLGPYMSGKTSLIQSMMDEQPRLEDPEERTIGVDVFDMPIETASEGEQTKPLNVSVWDFSGNRYFQFTHYYFMEQPVLVVLTFNMAKYTKQKFDEILKNWLEWILAKTKHLVLIVVGTQSDLVKNGDRRVKQICTEAMEGVRTHIDSHMEYLDSAVKDIESKPHISASLSEQFKLYMQLKKLKMDIYPEVIATSAATLSGVTELQKAIQAWSQNKETFPRTMQEIPSMWVDVEEWVEEQGNLMPVPIVTWEEFAEMVTEKFGMRHLMPSIAEYLHDTGKILYNPNNPAFSEYVILRPAMFLDCLKAFIRHDLEEVLDYAVDDRFKSAGMGVVKFNKFKSEIIQDGVLEREFAKAIWSNTITDDGRPDDIMRHLVYKFELAYPIGKKRKDGRYDLTVLPTDPSLSARSSSPVSESGMSTTSKTSRKSKKKPRVSQVSKASDEADGESVSSKKADHPNINKLLIPSLLKTSKPDYAAKEIKALRGSSSASSVFRFPRFVPPGLFERFCTRIRVNLEKYEFNFTDHWRNGVTASHAQKRLFLYIQRVTEEGGACQLRVEVRHRGLDREVEGSEDITKEEMESVWTALLPVIFDMEKLLEQFPGACFQRLMSCPVCRELGFIGEWLTPKELQGMEEKECSECGDNINTIFLVQPREKRGAELIRMKNERARQRKLEEERRQDGLEQDTADSKPQSHPTNSGRGRQRKHSSSEDLSKPGLTRKPSSTSQHDVVTLDVPSATPRRTGSASQSRTN